MNNNLNYLNYLNATSSSTPVTSSSSNLNYYGPSTSSFSSSFDTNQPSSTSTSEALISIEKWNQHKNFIRLMHLFPQLHASSIHDALFFCNNDLTRAIDCLLYALNCRAFFNAKMQGIPFNISNLLIFQQIIPSNHSNFGTPLLNENNSNNNIPLNNSNFLSQSNILNTESITNYCNNNLINAATSTNSYSNQNVNTETVTDWNQPECSYAVQEIAEENIPEIQENVLNILNEADMNIQKCDDVPVLNKSTKRKREVVTKRKYNFRKKAKKMPSSKSDFKENIPTLDAVEDRH